MVSSGLSTHPMGGLSGYAATKAGLEQFVRCLNLEVTHSLTPFQAIVVNPGMMDTEMQTQISQSDPNQFPSYEIFAKAKASGKIIPPAVSASNIVDLIDNEETWKK